MIMPVRYAARLLALLAVLSAPGLAAQELSVETVAVGTADPVPPGGTATVTYTVRNDGPGEADDVRVAILLSEDGSSDGAALLVETDDLDVEAGDTEDESVEVPIPSGTAPGCYTLLVVVDPANQIPEANEDDNVGGAEIAVGEPCEPLPDLRPDDVDLSRASVPRGGTFAVDVTVFNDGPGSVGFATVNVVLSGDDVLDFYASDSDDVESGFGIVDALGAGESQRISIPSEVPSALPPGDYTLFVAVDDGFIVDVIPETDETNNVIAVSFTVEGGVEGPLPDLSLVSVDPPDGPLIPGEYFVVYGTATSSETPRPENVYATTYLSADETISDDDISFGTLGAGGTSCTNDGCTFQIGRSVDLPNDVPEGPQFLIMAAWHDAADADSTDNVIAVPVTVAPPPLRIVVDPASAPTVPAGGGPVAVSALAVAGVEPIVFSWYAILERPDESEMGVAFQNDVALAAGEQTVLQTAFVISASDPPGEYVLTFYTEQGQEARIEWGQATILKVGATDAEDASTAGTALDPVAPNPTAGRSRVAYQTASAGPVRLAVYDALGREVAVLADGPAAAGGHQATLDASALPGGLYLVRLEAGGVVQTVPFTVAR